MKKVFAIGFTFLFVLTLSADFVSDFQKAEELFTARKFAEAVEVFEKLAASASDTAAKDRCFSYAAEALGKQRKYEEGIALANKISGNALKSYVKMQIMIDNGKWEDITSTFKDENIGEWPEDFAYKGFFFRGSALFYTGNFTAAVSDLEKAAAESGSDTTTKIIAFSLLAPASEKIQDDAKALKYADQAIAIKDYSGFHAWLSSALCKIEILTRQKKYDDAEATLKLMDRKWPENDPWHFQYLEAYGDLETARGNQTKAKEYYEQAIKIKTHQSFVERAQKKLDAMK